MAGIVVIDADNSVRQALSLVLEEAGYAVSATGEPAIALQLLESAPAPLVVLFDAGVPRISDGKITALIRREDPLLRRHAYICMSTSPGFMHPDLHQALRDLAVPIIAKPFDVDRMLTVVRQVAEGMPGRIAAHGA